MKYLISFAIIIGSLSIIALSAYLSWYQTPGRDMRIPKTVEDIKTPPPTIYPHDVKG